MKKAVLFDLDGTLLNTTKDIGLAMGKALGATFTDGQINRYIGNGLRNAIKAAAAELGLEDPDLDMLNDRLHAAYREVPVLYTAPYDGVPEVLAALQDRGIPMGVFSNKEQDLAEKVVSICLPDIRFEMVAGLHGKYAMKPSPEAIDAFCAISGVPKADTLYVGDSEVDCRTARNGKVDFRILSCGSRPRDFLLEKEVPESSLIGNIREIMRLF